MLALSCYTNETCKNGGTCLGSLDSAVCRYGSSFREESCQSDIDKCAENSAITGPFVRIHMAPILVTAAISSEENSVKMPLSVNMCRLEYWIG